MAAVDEEGGAVGSIQAEDVHVLTSIGVADVALAAAVGEAGGVEAVYRVPQ